jgi:hypothetical protein
MTAGVPIRRCRTAAPDLDPSRNLPLIGASRSSQLSLGAVSKREGRNALSGQAERDACQLGEQVWPITSNLPQLGHGVGQVVDPAAAGVVPSYRRDPCAQDLVSCAHALHPSGLELSRRCCGDCGFGHASFSISSVRTFVYPRLG